MSAPGAITEVWARVEAARDACLAARVTAIEDAPEHGRTLAVQRLGDTLDDVFGWLSEAQSVLGDGLATGDGDDRRWVELLAATDAHYRMAQERLADLSRWDRVMELSRLGERRGVPWPAWTRAIRAGTDELATAMAALDRAVHGAWHALATGAAPARTVSIHAHEED